MSQNFQQDRLFDLPETAVASKKATKQSGKKTALGMPNVIRSYEYDEDYQALLYTPRSLVLGSFPYKRALNDDGTPATSIVRRLPRLTLSLGLHRAQPGIFLPYGSFPRLFIAYATNQCVRTGSPVVDLGPSISNWLKSFNIKATGGEAGTISRLRSQLLSIRNTTIFFEWKLETNSGIAGGDVLFPIIERSQFWQPKGVERTGEYFIEFSPYFFNEICNRPVPIDFNTMLRLKSPMAMDLYTFLTYRVSYLRGKNVLISWQGLSQQFGPEYQRVSDFRRNFLDALKRVHICYPQLNFEVLPQGLLLKPSPTHISRKRIMEIDRTSVTVIEPESDKKAAKIQKKDSALAQKKKVANVGVASSVVNKISKDKDV